MVKITWLQFWNEHGTAWFSGTILNWLETGNVFIREQFFDVDIKLADNDKVVVSLSIFIPFLVIKH